MIFCVCEVAKGHVCLILPTGFTNDISLKQEVKAWQSSFLRGYSHLMLFLYMDF